MAIYPHEIKQKETAFLGLNTHKPSPQSHRQITTSDGRKGKLDDFFRPSLRVDCSRCSALPSPGGGRQLGLPPPPGGSVPSGGAANWAASVCRRGSSSSSSALAGPPRGSSPRGVVAEGGFGYGVGGTLPSPLWLDGLLVEVSQLREEPSDHLAELVVSDVALDRVPQQVQDQKGVVVGDELAQSLGGGQLVEAQVQNRELQEPVEALHVADLVPGQVELLDEDAVGQP